MAHLSEKIALHTHRTLDTDRLRFSLFHPSCTHIQNSQALNVEKGKD